MAYQNLKHYGWCPTNDYQVHEVAQPALRKRFDRPQHNNKGHVAFKINNNEEPVKAEASSPVPESDTDTSTIKHNKRMEHKAFESVDHLADAFIKQEHSRIELARLISMRGAPPTL